MAKMKIKKNYADGIEIEDYVFSVTQQEAARIEMPLEKKRVRVFMLIIAIAIIIAIIIEDPPEFIPHPQPPIMLPP